MEKEVAGTYHIACNTDSNFIQHCCAMLCSLFENNKEHRLCVHIVANGLAAPERELIDGLATRYQQEVVFYEADDSLLDGVQFRKRRPLTNAAYYRILYPSILPEDVDKLLYLDCDIAVLGDIAELMELDLSRYALAACKDPTPYNTIHRIQLNHSMTNRTFCSGVMLINLDYWRRHDAQTALLAFSKKKRVPVYLHDQDALNYVFKDQWMELPPKWNKGAMSIAPMDSVLRDFDIREYVFAPKIIHYAGELKPWCDINFPDREYYIKYLALSGYPNPVFKHIDNATRLGGYRMIVKYYCSRYIRPLVPDIIEMIFFDIVRLCTFILTALFKPKSLKHLMLKYWLRKYR